MSPEWRTSAAFPGARVIFAPGRGRRPRRTTQPGSPGRAESCPFCPANASRLSAPICSDGAGDGLVMVIANAFPLAAAAHEAPPEIGTQRSRSLAIGRHELVIESRDHAAGFATMDTEHVARVLRIWRDRGRALLANPAIETVTIFKNFGRDAGATLDHPHSQILALGAIPPRADAMMRGNRAWRYRHGACASCEGLGHDGCYAEIAQSAAFAAAKPFTGRQDWEVHFLPRAHRHCFLEESDAQLADLADLLGRTLRGLERVLGDFSYNLLLQAGSRGRMDGEWARAMHWRLELVPRTATVTGFELATGIDVNTVEPAEAAARLAGEIERLETPSGGR